MTSSTSSPRRSSTNSPKRPGTSCSRPRSFTRSRRRSPSASPGSMTVARARRISEHRGLFTNSSTMSAFDITTSSASSSSGGLSPNERSRGGRVSTSTQPPTLKRPEQWPEAIHHYLRAGLQRQAARLIANTGKRSSRKAGSDWSTSGCSSFPTRRSRATRASASSSARPAACAVSGIGPWMPSTGPATLLRRKGRSTTRGSRLLEVEFGLLELRRSARRAAELRQRGKQIAPDDAIATRLRLEGNLAITQDLAHRVPGSNRSRVSPNCGGVRQARTGALRRRCPPQCR